MYFSLVYLVIFMWLQGFFVTIWIAAELFKSNDIPLKQAALNSSVFIVHEMGEKVLLMCVNIGGCKERGKCQF
jgi:E3 ubiquitin-protein ligase RNFT1